MRPRLIGKQQAEIDKVTFDGIEPLTRLGQHFETGAEMAASGRVIAGESRFCRRDGLPLEVDLVEIAEVPHLPSQQLHLQIAGSQRQEVTRQIGIDGELARQRG